MRGPIISVGMSVTIRIDVFHCHDFGPAQSPFVDKAYSIDLTSVVRKRVHLASLHNTCV